MENKNIEKLLRVLIEEIKTSNRIKLLVARQTKQSKYIQDEEFIETYNLLVDNITKNTIENLEE